MFGFQIWRLRRAGMKTRISIYELSVIACAISFFWTDLYASEIRFTYLDTIDSSILYDPVLSRGTVRSGLFEIVEDASHTSGASEKKDLTYSLFSSDVDRLPGYNGERCIVDVEIALRLAEAQKELIPQGYSLKVFDAYRPQKAVDYLSVWKEEPEDPTFKKFHHPSVSKTDFGKLSYVASRSSHTRGVAVDLTIVSLDQLREPTRPEGFLGLWDPREIDMGNVGFLAFNERSGHNYTEHLEKDQRRNRKLLLELMWSKGFRKLRSEFWHYFLDMERNTALFYDFDIKDDYELDEDGIIMIPES